MTAPLPPDDTASLARSLSQVEQARLRPAEWNDVDQALTQLESAIRSGDLDRVHRVRATLANAGFRSHIRGRMGAAGTRSPAVAPTKRTPALPLVGIVCGGILMALGWLLGGGLLLAATAALGLFVLGIAVAGSRSFNERRSAGRRSAVEGEPTLPVPVTTAEALDRVRSLLEPD